MDHPRLFFIHFFLFKHFMGRIKTGIGLGFLMKRKITLTTKTDRNAIMAQLIVNKIYLGMIGFKLRIYGLNITFSSNCVTDNRLNHTELRHSVAST